MSDYSIRSSDVDLSGQRFAIIVSDYNDSVTGKLLDAARETLLQHGAAGDDIDVFHVPGAWELALGTQAILETNKYRGAVTLGAVIRGETTHDQYINRFVSQALGELSLKTRIPIGFGLLTCNTMEQAVARSGGNVGNKGAEAAMAMIGMVGLIESLSGRVTTSDIEKR